MANESIPDPSAQLQEWVTKWEREFNKYANRIMGTDEFSKSINQIQNLQLEFQRMVAEFMSKQLANLNMPSRDDLMKISEELRNLDHRMARIEGLLGKPTKDAKSPAKKSARPARTKKPPSSTAD